ncbi:hypothetical protein [Streptomyces sp. NPDC001811]
MADRSESSGVPGPAAVALDHEDPDHRPWGNGELLPKELSSPDDHEPAALLASRCGVRSVAMVVDGYEDLDLDEIEFARWRQRVSGCRCSLTPDERAERAEQARAALEKRNGYAPTAVEEQDLDSELDRRLARTAAR